MTSIEEAFGIAIRARTDLEGNQHPIPPPPRVLEVLGDLGHRQALEAPGHGPKTQKRRSKRRRAAARERFQRRTTLRAFGEHEKRKAAGA